MSILLTILNENNLIKHSAIGAGIGACVGGTSGYLIGKYKARNIKDKDEQDKLKKKYMLTGAGIGTVVGGVTSGGISKYNKYKEYLKNKKYNQKVDAEVKRLVARDKEEAKKKLKNMSLPKLTDDQMKQFDKNMLDPNYTFVL